MKATMLKTIPLTILVVACFGADSEPRGEKKPPSVAEALYEKAVSDSTKDCEKQYDLYLKSLEVANKKVIAFLESGKKDLNDPSKGRLTIAERAKALEEIDAKIAEVKRGSIGEQIAERSGEKSDGGAPRINVPKAIMGKWNWSWSGWTPFTFEKNGGIANWWIPGGRWKVDANSVNTVLVEDNQWKYTIVIVGPEELAVTRNDGEKNTMNKKPSK